MNINPTKFDKKRSTFGFIISSLIILIFIILPTPESFIHFVKENYSNLDDKQIKELAYGMKVVTALLLLMVTLWLTEAIPIPVTSLLPAIVLPVFHVVGVSNDNIHHFDGKNVLANYANPIIYLFLSGFLIARAMQKWGLDRRLTYSILSFGNLANHPKLIILALIFISAMISMWISNTATTAMLLPIVIGITRISKIEKEGSNFSKALALAIAYGASVGGLGTIIGSPPNGICVSILRSGNVYNFNFIQWMALGLPIVFVFIPVIWFLLIKVFPPELSSISGGKEYIQALKKELGGFSRGEKFTSLGFFLLLTLWVSNPFWSYILPHKFFVSLHWFDENLIALSVTVLLFMIPVSWKDRKFVLEWSDSKFVDWGTLLLFGGGIALSDAMFKTGFASWLAKSIVTQIGSPSPFLIVVVVIILIDFLTEITSNTAVVSMMVPILISISSGINADPVLLSISATLAASMAFMLPVATPPNAIVYGSGYLKITDMIKAGFLLDIIAWFILTLSIYFFGDIIFNIVKF